MSVDQVQWRPDTVLEGYECTTLELPLAVPAPGEPADARLAGTLVRRNPPTSRRAMLYLHGWSDYFFQTHLADAMHALGFDFYAVELRRYGRGLTDGLLGGYIEDLDEYSAELDAALEVVKADHDHVTLMAHSTGGLIGSLWADRRPGELNGVILNSAWIDMQGSVLLNAISAPVIKQLGPRLPTRVIPLPDSGLYGRSIHADMDGEWHFDAGLKAHPSFAVRVGWMNAIIRGHKRIAQGLAIDTPVLSMMSARSDFRRTWDPCLLECDTVLDAERLARRSARLGPHVTVVRLDGGLHDLVLSREPVRLRFFDEVDRWSRAYLRGM